MSSSSLQARLFDLSGADVLAPNTRKQIEASDTRIKGLSQKIKELALKLHDEKVAASIYGYTIREPMQLELLNSCPEILHQLKAHIIGNTVLLKQFSLVDKSQKTPRLMLNLPDFIPIKEMVDAFNLIREMSLCINSNAQKVDLNLAEIEAAFFKLIGSNLPLLVNARRTLQTSLRGPRKTNIETSLLAKKLDIVDEMLKSFAVLGAVIEFRKSMMDFFEKNHVSNEKIAFLMSNDEHVSSVQIDFLPPPIHSYESMMKCISDHLNECIARWGKLGNIELNDNNSFGLNVNSTIENIVPIKDKFNYFFSQFSLIVSRNKPVFCMGNLNQNVFVQLDHLANVSLIAKKALDDFLIQIENNISSSVNCSKNIRENAFSKVSGKKGKQRVGRDKSFVEYDARPEQSASKSAQLTEATTLTSMPHASKLLDGLKQDEHDELNALVDTYKKYYLMQDDERKNSRIANFLNSIDNSAYYNSKNNFFNLDHILKYVDVFWAAQGATAFGLVASIAELRVIIKKSPDLAEIGPKIENLVQAFNRDIIGIDVLYKKSFQNTLAHLEYLLRLEQIERMSKPVCCEINTTHGLEQSWLLSVTVFFKKNPDETTQNCDIHFHLSKPASGFEDLDRIVTRAHIKKMTFHDGQKHENRVHVQAQHAIDFLRKCKTHLEN